jgi:hypothetical protein
MTTATHDHLSVQDMMFMLAEDRIADLRASAPATLDERPAATPVASTSPGIVTRSRDALGRRLIALGRSLVSDDGVRQQALNR